MMRAHNVFNCTRFTKYRAFAIDDAIVALLTLSSGKCEEEKKKKKEEVKNTKFYEIKSIIIMHAMPCHATQRHSMDINSRNNGSRNELSA